MSTLMEDRLTAALRARAEQVQPQDLRPLDVPVVPLAGARRRRRTAVLAGLAAAAVAAAVAGPLVLGGEDGTGSPQPAGPTDSEPTSSTQRPAPGLAADVDGDGRADTVRLVEEGVQVRLVVVLAGGERFETPLDAAAPDAAPVTPGDLGGTSGEELVVPVSNDPADLPAVFTMLPGEGLVRATYPESGLQGWQADSSVNRWSADEGGLRTWETESVPGNERVPFWDWSVDDQARLRPSGMMLGCLGTAGAEPVACEGPDRWGKDEADMGPRGDLPTLMPAIAETLRDERFFYSRGPARGDYAQLQGDFGEEGGAVAEGDVQLVATALGEEHRIPLPAGQSPRLVAGVLVVAGDAPVFAVSRSGGDTALLELYTFWNGELIQVEPRGDVFLGSGVVDFGGEITEQRTWLTPDGAMFTAVLLDPATRRQHLWQWDDDLDAETIEPTDLGEVCIDWETGKYGRCG